ncbi:hypothetical protein L1987_35413 [Smallanthus sonchifolius]|uniref:Uncharacterized protein n=1 Tax=Smallanthus sonchifolius TaxID=185202 RepID=A0ACB9HYA8_9ASTR|nr:hypothetical protein L1987_35413 [Smallanthus sonchifolius]
MCGFEPTDDLQQLPAFTSAYKYSSDIQKAYDGFKKHFNDCLYYIQHMVAFEDLTPSLYNEYKANCSEHILRLKTYNRMHIKSIFKQHEHTSEEMKQLSVRYTELNSDIQERIEEIKEYNQCILQEIKGKKERMDALMQRISDPDTKIKSRDRLIEEVKDLKISKTRMKHVKRYSEWKNYIDETKTRLDQTWNSLYEAEISVNSLRLQNVVELSKIQKKTLSSEQEQQFVSRTNELKSLLTRCIQLSKEEQAAIEKINQLDEE